MTASNPGDEEKEEGEGDGAVVKLEVKGSPQETTEALKKLGAQSERPSSASPEEMEDALAEQQRREEEERDRELQKLFLDPKNMIVVKRILPRTFQGRKASGEVGRYECPANVDDIAEDVFERFGGRKFKVAVHAASNAGIGRLLDAVVIENPDTDEPFFNGTPSAGAPGHHLQMPHGMAFSDDPTAVVDDDPLTITEQSLRDQAKILNQRMRVKELRRSMREMDEEETGERKPNNDHDHRDEEIAELRHRLNDQAKSREMDNRFAALERKLDEGSTNKGDGGMTAITQMMQQSNQQFTQMMQAMNTQNQQTTQHMMTLLTESMKKPNQEEKFDTMLERMVAMKQAFVTDDPKAKRIEEMMMEVAFEKLTNTGTIENEEDVLKFAVKELAPILKDMVNRKEPQQPQQMTPEQKQEAYREAAQQVVADLTRRGALQHQPQPRALPASTHPPAPQPTTPQEAKPGEAFYPQGTPQPQPPPGTPPGKQAEVMPGTETEVELEPVIPQNPQQSPSPRVGEHEAPTPGDHPETEEEEMELPASPQSSEYDRKASVNFILESLLGEVAERVPFDKPNESYVVGDCLNLLDDELLGDLLGVATGDQLSAWLAPYGEATLIEDLKTAGHDEIVKSWITRIIVTVKDEYRRQLERPHIPQPSPPQPSPPPEVHTPQQSGSATPPQPVPAPGTGTAIPGVKPEDAQPPEPPPPPSK